MRPNAVEVIRGLQSALGMGLLPELTTMYAQAEAQNAVMLLEMLANEWDTAAEELAGDNRTMGDILSRAAAVIEALPQEARDDSLRKLAADIGGALPAGDQSLSISALTARHTELRALLERLIVACEDAVDDPKREPLMPVRAQVYAHLRKAAIRGWSFWDTFSFRERMARVRQQSASFS